MNLANSSIKFMRCDDDRFELRTFSNSTASAVPNLVGSFCFFELLVGLLVLVLCAEVISDAFLALQHS